MPTHPIVPTPISLTPIGVVTGGRSEPIDDDWDAVEATIVLDPAQLDADATAGLDAFSHLDVVFAFHRVPDRIPSGKTVFSAHQTPAPTFPVDRAILDALADATKLFKNVPHEFPPTR